MQLFAEITHSRVSLLKRFASRCSRTDAGTNSHQQSCEDYVCCLRTLQKDTLFMFLQPRWKTDPLKCCWGCYTVDCVRHKTRQSEFPFVWNNHSLGQKEVKISGSLIQT